MIPGSEGSGAQPAGSPAGSPAGLTAGLPAGLPAALSALEPGLAQAAPRAAPAGPAAVPRALSIRRRLLRTLLTWALLWCTALATAVWLAVKEEVDELLDDSLQSTAEGLLGPLARNLNDAPAAAPLLPGPARRPGGGRFTWQVVQHAPVARLVAAAQGGPTVPLHDTPTAGFSDVAEWRVYGVPLGHDSQMLYAAQARFERREAQAEIGVAVLLAGVPMILLALLWLRARVRHELAPLQALSDRLADHDPLQPGATLGLSSYEELRPMQAAIDALAARLAQRLNHERAFTAHAAHALRTPLAGIDAQLAVALREVPPEQQLRLQRVRAAAGRLQRVVAALLALFRSGVEVQRVPLDLAALVARLPVAGLTLHVQATHRLLADADLLTAALSNLLDNALRHGARSVHLSTPAAGLLQVQDDGPGMAPAPHRDLQQALATQAYEGRMGLGLMLADLVARAHGGTLTLPAAGSGFVALLSLGPA